MMTAGYAFRGRAMAATPEADLDQVLREHTTLLFHQYEVRAKSYRTTLFWLLAVSGAFLLLILFPYLSIRNELHLLPDKLERIEVEIDRRDARIDAFRRSQEGFSTLIATVRSGPEELRAFLAAGMSSDPLPPPIGQQAAPDLAIQQVLPNVQQQGPVAPAGCAALVGVARVGCLVEGQVRAQFDGYREILARGVLGPLQGSEGAGAALIRPEALKAGLDRLEAGFGERIAAQPDFWLTFQGKGDFFSEVESDIAAFWSEYETLLAAQSEALAQEKAALVAAQAEMRAAADQMAALQAKLEARLDQVDTPLGRLPVGLNEAILGFPVLLAAGFLLGTSQFADAVRARAAFQALYRRRDPERRILTDRQIALIAPLWIDPYERGRGWTVAVLILAAPLAIFLIAVGAVAYSWLGSDSFRAAGALNLRIFAGLYVLSLLGLGAGLMRVRAALAEAPKDGAAG